MVNILLGVCVGVLIGLGLNDLIENNVKRDIDKLLEEKRERLRLLEEKTKF
ncbi:hypothetical protein [Bacillus thuringiensis]|uniref:hypothetical protein n=1 Tax=Bacillus thuringiensis TaxID=1428 RepID=UPI0014835568|nr:hypothetical protein [Bacillus thuringiensis]